MDRPEQGDEAVVTPGTGQYFSSDPKSSSKPSMVLLTLADLTVRLVSDRGVFSSDRVDPGTKLLLMELPALPPGPALDLGCGYGPIATTLAMRRPDDPIWAVDVNPRALDLCSRNLAAHAAPSTTIHVSTPEAIPADQQFNAIVSNPPIRIGKVALHSLLQSWLGRLNPDGEAWLVVHKHLGADSLARWLSAEGFHVERIRSRSGYRVLRVRPSGPSVGQTEGVDL